MVEITKVSLPNGFVLPSNEAPFDYVTLIRLIAASALKKNVMNPNVEFIPPDTEIFDAPSMRDVLIRDSDIPRDVQISFNEMYLMPAMRLAEIIERTGSTTHSSLGRPPKQLGLVNIASNITQTSQGRQSAISANPELIKPVVERPQFQPVSNMYLRRLDTFLKARLYKRQITKITAFLSFIEYISTRRTKNKAEFYPSISLLVTPSQSFVFDVFVGGERLNTFSYGAPSHNQIVAPDSISDNFEGVLTPTEANQYRLGMEEAVRIIMERVRDSNKKARTTAPPKVTRPL